MFFLQKWQYWEVIRALIQDWYLSQISDNTPYHVILFPYETTSEPSLWIYFKHWRYKKKRIRLLEPQTQG